MVTRFLSKLFGNGSEEAAATAETPAAVAATTTTDLSDDEASATAFVEYAVRSLVMHPAEVSVTTETDDQGLLVRIHCRQDEVGRVIGKSGKTIRAIRTLVKGVAARHNQKASVVVMED